MPLVIHRAARGDWGPFAASSPTGAIASVAGMYLTITCSETASIITEEDSVRETRDTFVGEDRTRRHLRACREWPRPDVPPSFYEPVVSQTPVLILSGELDAATPPSLAMQDLMAEFVARASARGLDVSCVQTLRRPPFVTEISRASRSTAPAQ